MRSHLSVSSGRLLRSTPTAWRFKPSTPTTPAAVVAATVMTTAAVGVVGAMAATVAEAISAETATAAPAIASRVVRTGLARDRRTVARAEAAAGLLEVNRAAKTREEGRDIAPPAHPPTRWRGGKLGHSPLTSR